MIRSSRRARKTVSGSAVIPTFWKISRIICSSMFVRDWSVIARRMAISEETRRAVQGAGVAGGVGNCGGGTGAAATNVVIFVVVGGGGLVKRFGNVSSGLGSGCVRGAFPKVETVRFEADGQVTGVAATTGFG